MRALFLLVNDSSKSCYCCAFENVVFSNVEKTTFSKHFFFTMHSPPKGLCLMQDFQHFQGENCPNDIFDKRDLLNQMAACCCSRQPSHSGELKKKKKKRKLVNEVEFKCSLNWSYSGIIRWVFCCSETCFLLRVLNKPGLQQERINYVFKHLAERGEISEKDEWAHIHAQGVCVCVHALDFSLIACVRDSHLSDSDQPASDSQRAGR